MSAGRRRPAPGPWMVVAAGALGLLLAVALRWTGSAPATLQAAGSGVAGSGVAGSAAPGLGAAVSGVAVMGPAAPPPALADRIADRPAVVEFWASWCLPCRASLAAMVKADKPLGAAGAAVVGVDERDSTGAAVAARRRAGARYPDVADPHAAIARAYGVVGTPTVLVLNRRGRVVQQMVGPVSARQILAAMRPVLAS